jgi:carbamoyltransferase
MIILGISYLSDAGACIIRDGKLISVINEERLNRIKLFHGIPSNSINFVLEDAGISMKDVDVIVTHGFYENNDEGIEFIDDGMISEAERRPIAFAYVEDKINRSKLNANQKKEIIQDLKARYKHEDYVIHDRNPNIIKQLKKYGKPIKVVEHHMGHAAGAYFFSGWNDCYIITADGWGEMESNILCHAKNGLIQKIAYSHSFDSLGYFYGSITKALGFIPHRHEGKVLGLAALGNPDTANKWMQSMIYYNKEHKRFEGGYENGLYLAKFENPRLESLIKEYSREDIAASAQKTLEKVMLEYVDNVIPKGSRVVVAGGIFANVVLNQRLLENPKIRDLFVYPQMGDGGLAVGCGIYYHSRIQKHKPIHIGHLYRGPGYTNQEILTQLQRIGCSYAYHRDIEKVVATLLLKNNAVMRFKGKMEYGPRALGNRSILYPTNDKNVNDWLNKALRRSEFMPFAPMTMKEYATKCYKNINNHWKNALFMTMTFTCTEWMKKNSPGVVHVDDTARPQIVTKTSNPSCYKILKYYNELSGIPSLINTSFNMHEEPIVCTPSDALRAFQDSRLKYLAIENYLVTNDSADILFEHEN